MENLQITFVGGGNLVHTSIGQVGHFNPGLKMNLLTRRPAEWSKEIVTHTDKSSWKEKGDLIGTLNVISDNPADVIPGSKIIIIGAPAHVHGEILAHIKEFVDPGAFVGTLFGEGAFDLQAQSVFGDDLKNKDITIWALFNVPYICKIIKYGKETNMVGPKKHLYVATFPKSKDFEICYYLSLLYYMPTKILPNFLTIILTPSNKIIHPGRVMGYWGDWDGKTAVDPATIPRLYLLNQASADNIQNLDDEIQKLKRAILDKFGMINLEEVLPIKERIIKQYGEDVKDKSTLLSTFNTNTGYDVLTFPVVPVEGGVLLNTKCRFFTEDIPYGLCIMKSFADVFEVSVPYMEQAIRWHQRFMGVEFLGPDNKLVQENLHLTGSPFKYGFTTPEDFVRSSLPQ